MNNWTWIIPLIALVVWILANLFRVPQQDPRQREQPSRPRQPPNRNPPPRQQPVSDFDKFLQDVQRERRESEREAPPSRQRPASPPPRSRSTPPPRSRSTPPPLPRQSKPKPVVLQPAPERSSRPPATPAPSRSPATVPNIEALEAVNLPEVIPVARQTPGARKQPLPRRKSTGVANTIMGLLENPESARAAIILREILDRPVSRRRRR